MKPDDAAREQYRAAAEWHAERALRYQDEGNRDKARIHARLALRCQDEAAYVDVVAERLRRYVG